MQRAGASRRRAGRGARGPVAARRGAGAGRRGGRAARASWPRFPPCAARGNTGFWRWSRAVGGAGGAAGPVAGDRRTRPLAQARVRRRRCDGRAGRERRVARRVRAGVCRARMRPCPTRDDAHPRVSRCQGRLDAAGARHRAARVRRARCAGVPRPGLDIATLPERWSAPHGRARCATPARWPGAVRSSSWNRTKISCWSWSGWRGAGRNRRNCAAGRAAGHHARTKR